MASNHHAPAIVKSGQGDGKATRKHVCVIGAGTSGLILMKELQEAGHTFECFESLPAIGGVYVKSYASTVLTTSSLLTAWSDYSDGNEEFPKFWTADEYLEYVRNFAEKFDLVKHIRFCHKVDSVRRSTSTTSASASASNEPAPKKGRSRSRSRGRKAPAAPAAGGGDATSRPWNVTVSGGQGSDAWRATKVKAKAQAPETRQFDCIAVCSGTNNFSALPTFDGQDSFTGDIVHSEHYTTPDVFKGKRVLVVGAGESGSDITNEISMVASKTAIAIRGKHGHLIPRIQGNGRVTDLNTNRCRYSNPYIFGDWVGYFNQIAKRTVASMGPPSDLNKVLKKIGELNMKQGTSAFSKFGCKNEGFVSAIVLRGAELHRDTFELQGNKAIFKDGSEFECDSIVACTGYRNCFPFFDEHHPEISYHGCNPRTNYKQIMCAAHPNEIGFFGFARPAFGSIPPTTEMQARFWVAHLSGELVLPNTEEMTESAAYDQAQWEWRFGWDAKRVKGLVDFQLYTDSLADQIGCMPKLRELFFTNISVWCKIMFGPFTMHQYRLYGPHSNRERAIDVYKRQPVGDFMETVITLSFLLLAKVLSLLGFTMFTPNSF